MMSTINCKNSLSLSLYQRLQSQKTDATRRPSIEDSLFLLMSHPALTTQLGIAPSDHKTIYITEWCVFCCWKFSFVQGSWILSRKWINGRTGSICSQRNRIRLTVRNKCCSSSAINSALDTSCVSLFIDNELARSVSVLAQCNKNPLVTEEVLSANAKQPGLPSPV